MKLTKKYCIPELTEEQFEKLDHTAVLRSPDSPGGYVVTFRLRAPERDWLAVQGDWMFSDIHHSSTFQSARIWPHEWRKGLFPHTLLGLRESPDALKDGRKGAEIDVTQFDFDWDVLNLGMYEMDKDPKTGIFRCTIPLPTGIYNYQFITEIPEGNPLRMKTVSDPATESRWNDQGELHAKCQIAVPKGAGKCSEMRSRICSEIAEDISLQIPDPDGERGSVVCFTYPTDHAFGVGEEQRAMVYLPAGYNDKHTKPYPVIYLSHGGGGNALSWMTEGAIPSIMNNLIHAKLIEPMVVVTMSNEVFQWENQARTIPNITNCLIPAVERSFHVARTRERRYFAGFSAGGFLAYEIYEAKPELFSCVGIWSGGCRFEMKLSDPELKNTEVHVGAGRYDDAYFSFGAPLENALYNAGLPFTSYTPLGGHQWNVWRKLFIDFVTRVVSGRDKGN